MAIEVGQEAPDSTPRDEHAQGASPAGLRGSAVARVVYPFDFSGTCTTEHCDMTDNRASWVEQGAKDQKGGAASEYDRWNEAAGAVERAAVVIARDHSEVVQHTK